MVWLMKILDLTTLGGNRRDKKNKNIKSDAFVSDFFL